MKKKICFFSGDITRSGGTERVAVQLANELHRDPALEVCFVSLTEQQPQPFYPLHPGIPRARLSPRWIRPGPGYLPLVGRLRRFLKAERIDVIVDIDIVLDALSLPAAKGLNTKVVSWEHFTCEFEQSVPYRKWILRYSVRRSDQVVVLTDGDLRDYRERLGRTQAIRRIYNPVAYRLPDAAAPLRENLILTVGRLAPEKGIGELERVALPVLQQHPDWRWVILGEGALRADLEDFIARHRLEDRLLLEGNIVRVDDYLRRASLMVITSHYEGLGLSMLEAREMKVPCVGFDVKMGPREVIRSGIDGYLVPPFDCDAMAGRIDELIRDPALRRRFAENAFAAMEGFRTESITRQWKELLAAIQ